MQDKITINPFDPDSIDEAIKKLGKRKERIHKCAEKLIQRLTDLGVEKAQELVPVDTGTARSSIIGYLDERRPVYESEADCVIPVTGRDVEEIVDELVSIVE